MPRVHFTKREAEKCATRLQVDYIATNEANEGKGLLHWAEVGERRKEKGTESWDRTDIWLTRAERVTRNTACKVLYATC